MGEVTYREAEDVPRMNLNCLECQSATRDSQLRAPTRCDRLRRTDATTAERLLSTTSILHRKDSYSMLPLFDQKSCTYSYLLADQNTKEAILIDPVLEQVDRDAKLINELGLRLAYAVNTHVHADHITGSGKLKEIIQNCRSVISAASKAKADDHLNPGDIFGVGCIKLEARATPGHTNGNPECLYDSVHSQILSLPYDYNLYPAHDYKGQTTTTVGEELKHNPRLTKSKEEFVDIMNNLNLSYPKMIDQAVPANMVCGLHEFEETS
ncbi:uncharacterized protein LOC119171673 isoform X2 [Rhipicephalus microplus]|uniref:uncharacterized protein LOC119171673 isoform X2 n=1 Tax=Rhipicephalus microplus TaxID=6941 RepID=UPI003F6D42E2